jgi:hypothetical protein
MGESHETIENCIIFGPYFRPSGCHCVAVHPAARHTIHGVGWRAGIARGFSRKYDNYDDGIRLLVQLAWSCADPQDGAKSGLDYRRGDPRPAACLEQERGNYRTALGCCGYADPCRIDAVVVYP